MKPLFTVNILKLVLLFVSLHSFFFLLLHDLIDLAFFGRLGKQPTNRAEENDDHSEGENLIFVEVSHPPGVCDQELEHALGSGIPHPGLEVTGEVSEHPHR